MESDHSRVGLNPARAEMSRAEERQTHTLGVTRRDRNGRRKIERETKLWHTAASESAASPHETQPNGSLVRQSSRSLTRHNVYHLRTEHHLSVKYDLIRGRPSTQLHYWSESTETAGQILQVNVVKTDFHLSKSTEVLAFKTT